MRDRHDYRKDDANNDMELKKTIFHHHSRLEIYKTRY